VCSLSSEEATDIKIGHPLTRYFNLLLLLNLVSCIMRDQVVVVLLLYWTSSDVCADRWNSLWLFYGDFIWSLPASVLKWMECKRLALNSSKFWWESLCVTVSFMEHVGSMGNTLAEHQKIWFWDNGSYGPTECNERLLARTAFSMVWSSCVSDTFLCLQVLMRWMTDAGVAQKYYIKYRSCGHV